MHSSECGKESKLKILVSDFKCRLLIY